MLSLPQTTDQIGRYQILAELGRGSIGQVYLARDPNIDRNVALKVFLPLLKVQAKEREELRRRFILEAKAAGRVEHPGIVTIFDADTDSATGLSYMAMEWIEGRSLQEELAEDGLPAPTRTLEIVERVALALDAAHRQGLVHRDVKPGNILCGREGVIKVTDFGIAKLASMSITHSNWIHGSPFYMSPEQLRNENVDPRSDIYSLGAVLYECLTGCVPFEGDSLPSLTYMILEIDPRPPQTLDPSVDANLARVAMRALAKSPAERFQSALDFSRALRGIDPIRTTAPVELWPPDPPRPAQDTAGSTTQSIPLPAAPAPSGEAPVAEPTPAARPRAEDIGSVSRVRWPALLMVALAGVAAVLYGLWSPDPIASSQAETPSAISVERAQRFGSTDPESGLANGLDLKGLPQPPEFEDPESRRPEPKPPARVALASPPKRALRAPEPVERVAPSSRSAPTPAPTTPEPREAAAPEPRVASPPPAPIETGLLEIVYRNRLKAGTISIFMDEKKIWTRTFTGAKSLFKRTFGKDIWTTLRIPAGDHVIDVRVTGAEAKLDLVRRTEVSMAVNETRRLRVVLIPPRNLRLSWKHSPDG